MVVVALVIVAPAVLVSAIVAEYAELLQKALGRRHLELDDYIDPAVGAIALQIGALVVVILALIVLTLVVSLLTATVVLGGESQCCHHG